MMHVPSSPSPAKPLLALVLSALLATACGPTPEESAEPPAPQAPETVSAPAEVTFDATAAEAVLEILASRRQGLEVPEELWGRLFTSEAYRRLGERKEAMGRPFEEADFRAFVTSPELAEREAELARTLEAWREIDLAAWAGQVAAFLPEEATIRATVYPMIKPRQNSFVWDLENDPAIFLYLDPAVTPEKFANTVLHELHHVGFGTACPPPRVAAEIEALPEEARKALRWMGAFGEGFAMLAAAGGADVHPHAVSLADEKERWDADVARFPEDRAKVEAFFQDLLAGRLGEEEEIARARSFYGVQGPWYTVGWKMAATIETGLGREALIGAFCDPRRLLPAYHRALDEGGPGAAGGDRWSTDLVAALGGT